MAEQIGSIEFDISINDINADKILKEVTAGLKDMEDAANEASKSLDSATKDLSDAADKTTSAYSKMSKESSEAMTNAVKGEEQLAETSKATESAVADVTSATENLNAVTVETTAAATDFTNELYALTVQTLELIRNGETESELYDELKEKITELLSANQEYAQNPPFSEEQTEKLREYKDELIDLYGEITTANTVEGNAASTEEAVAAAVESAASETAEQTKATKKNSAAAKENGTIWNYLGKLFKVNLPAGATAAKFAIESLKMALSAGLLTVITMLSEAISKLVDKLTFSFRVQGMLNEKVASSTAEAVTTLKVLQKQWNSLGNDLNEKERFIHENKSAFDSLGVSINSVNEAEKLLVTKTQSFVAALMARARAAAAQELMQEKLKDSLEDLADIEDKISKYDEAVNRYKNQILEYKENVADPNNLRLDNLQNLLAVATVELNKYKKKKDSILTDIDKDTSGLTNIITQAVKDAENAMKDASVDASEDLKNYSSYLAEKKKAYKNYAENLKSTNAEVRKNAADIAGVNTTQGKTYTQWIQGELKRLKSEMSDINAKDYDSNKNRYNLLMQELGGIMQASQTQYTVFAEKLVEIESNRIKQLQSLTGQDATKEIDINTFADNDIKILKAKYGIIGDELADGVINQIHKILKMGEPELAAEIARLQEKLRSLTQQRDAAGNLVKDSKAIAETTANLKAAEAAYESLREKTMQSSDYADKIAKYREFAEKLVEIENVRISKLQNLSGPEAGKEETINAFADHDIELLKSEYGIVGDDLGQAILDEMNATLKLGEDDLVARIIDLRTKLADLTAQGSTADTSVEVAKLSAGLKAATDAYSKLKANATEAGEAVSETNDELKKKEAYDRLKKGINECAQSFRNIGQQIGGAAGESLEFIGNLTDNVMSTISAIQTYANLTANTIKGVGTATATAIRTVETASVILAIISAAMQIAMQLVQLFQKDKETYEDKKNVYEGYISVLDTIIDREKELAKTLEAQQAAAQYDAIGENIKKQEESTRRIAVEYLHQGTKGKNNQRGHTVGYKMAEKLNSADWLEFQRALGGEAYKQVYGTRLMGLFDLSGEQLKKLQENATGFYSKLDSETRGYIEDIIRYSDNAANLEYEKWESINGISFDGFKDNFMDALSDIDVSAEKITENIREMMRKSLIDNMFKKDYASKLDDYYAQWGRAMENDGKIDDTEWDELNTLADSIAQGATAAAEAINARFKTTEEEIEEGGLSGAIKNASQESIDLLAGQTNAVRMNQVEGMALARESLDAVMAIHVQVTLCAQYLNSINTAVNSPGSDRARGII